MTECSDARPSAPTAGAVRAPSEVGGRAEVGRVTGPEARARQLVAATAHELRGPLTTILTFTELLERESSGRTAEQAAVVRRSALRLDELVGGLLTIERISALGAHPRSALALDELVREAVADAEPLAAAKDVRIEAVIEPGPPLAGDALAVQSLVANLLANAVQYSHPGGDVLVGVRHQHGWWELKVTDHGIGIPPVHLGKVFDRFYRAPNGARATPGSGLGLSIVRAAAERHGGRVQLASEPDRGTTVTVELPAGP